MQHTGMQGMMYSTLHAAYMQTYSLIIGLGRPHPAESEQCALAEKHSQPFSCISYDQATCLSFPGVGGWVKKPSTLTQQACEINALTGRACLVDGDGTMKGVGNMPKP